MRLHIVVYMNDEDDSDMSLDELLELVGMILIGGEDCVAAVQS